MKIRKKPRRRIRKTRKIFKSPQQKQIKEKNKKE